MIGITPMPPLLPPSGNFADLTTSLIKSITTITVNEIDMNGGKIVNLGNPTNPTDAANKQYVDAQAGGGGNLTGPISATAGVTSITSQTGTGTTFVVQTSPVLITPNIGVASGTSIDLSGLFSTTGVITSLNTLNANGSPNVGAFSTDGGGYFAKDVYIGGNCSADEFFAVSDKRLKSNIERIDRNDIDKLMSVSGYSYNLRNDPITRYGIIAQELEDKGLGLLVDNSCKYKKVSYQSFIPIILETIKDQRDTIECLEERIKFLERKIII